MRRVQSFVGVQRILQAFGDLIDLLALDQRLQSLSSLSASVWRRFRSHATYQKPDIPELRMSRTTFL